MRQCIFILTTEVLCIPGLLASGKPDTLHPGVEPEFERALEIASEQEDVTPLLELLDAMNNEPLDLNLATSAELEQIPGLSSLMVYRIVSRRSHERFRSMDDLAKLEGMTPDILRAVDPFVTVRTKSDLAPGARHHVQLRTRAGRNSLGYSLDPNGRYGGSPEKLYTRLLARIDGASDGDEEPPGGLTPSVSLGLVSQKDPGERTYLDFLSGNLCATLPGISTKIVLGDFQMNAGQGLVFGRTAGFSKGSEATAGIARDGAGIRPSFSTDEATFFRGGAINVKLGQSSVSLFYSNKSLDARIDSSESGSQIDIDGLHRTEAELQESNSVTEISYGVRYSTSPIEGLKAGVSGLFSKFDRVVSFPGMFGFKGNRATSIGVDINYTQSSWCTFAEVALDGSRRRAGALGLVLNPGPGLNLAFLARFYPADFRSLRGSGFSENGNNDANESGYYCGVTFRPGRWLNINAYYDQFVFPWRTTFTNFPSNGHELFVRADVNPVGKVNLELQVRHKNKPDSYLVISGIGLTDRSDDCRAQQNVRATLTAGSPKSVLWRSRVEVVSVRYPSRAGSERGLLLYQDFAFNVFGRVSLTVRAVAFDTDSFDSRLYEYEEEVPGTCQNPALYGKGIRCFLIGRLSIAQGIAIACKYSQTRRDEGRRSALSNQDMKSGMDDRMALQCDISL